MKFIEENRNKNLEKNYNYGNYWTQNGKDSNILIKSILGSYNYSFTKKFPNLIYGNIIMVEIQYIMKLYDENSRYDLWTLLFHSRYITLVDRKEYK